MSDKILIIDNLSFSYGHIKAINNISLEIKKGEVVTILGANGAGKTTTLMTISGILKASTGSIRYKNIEISRMPAHEIVTLGISHVPEGRRIFNILTVVDNLKLGAYTKKKVNNATLDWIYHLFPRLAERRKQLAGTLSGGEQQMLAIGRALMSEPEMLLLDEPSLGLAPILTEVIFKTLKQIKQSGVTVLLVEQNARAALNLADRGYVLEVGKTVMSGTATELLSSNKIQESYLGKKKKEIL